MSIREVLASIPCINSLKIADTIMRECAGKGLSITFQKRDLFNDAWGREVYPNIQAEFTALHGGHEFNVPPVMPLPEDGA